MTLIRWEPLREVDTLQREMNRLFEAFLPTTPRHNGELAFAPAVELHETTDAVTLKLEAPGIEAKDLDIQVTEESVLISGERKSETKSDEKGVIRSEFRYGKFQRVIPMPARIDNQHVKADYNHGVLTLTLPKAEEEKNKVVKVNLN